MHKPLNRPYDYAMLHSRDEIKNLGYDYRTTIFEKTLSRQLFANKKTAKLLREIQKMIYFLIEQVKLLKTRYLIAVDVNENRLN